MSPPRVSVIVPNYNHARFLRERLGSVLGQTFTDFELLFLDDGSTDGSREVFAEFSSDPRVRAIFNERNSGNTFVQWNRGLREARGEYVWLAESDDYADPEFLAILVAQLDAHPSVGLVHCGLTAVGPEGVLALPDYPEDPRWKTDFVSPGAKECVEQLLFDNPISNASGVLFRRRILEQIGGADESLRLCGDWMVYAKMLTVSDVAYVARKLNFFRRQGTSVSGKLMHSYWFVLERYAVAEFILKNHKIPDATRRAICAALADGWFTCARSPAPAKDWHWRIYLRARRIDPQLHQRAWANALRPWLGQMKDTALHKLALRAKP